MTIDEELIYTTIRIEVETKQGNVCSGTGFFFDFASEELKKQGKIIPCLVTNKHVVNGGAIGHLKFHLSDDQGNPILGEFEDVNLNSFESLWIKHPNPDVDLCVFPVASLMNASSQVAHKNLFFKTLSKDLIPTSEETKNFSNIEDIIFIGYPDGIYDSHNNLPIVRKGITATSVKIDFENKPQFLIDASVYGGSSGSPVYLYSMGTFSRGTTLVIGNRVKLLGVISGVYKHFVGSEIQVEEAPTSVTLNPGSFTPNNLGIVIKSNQLSEFENILNRANAGR